MFKLQINYNKFQDTQYDQTNSTLFLTIEFQEIELV